MLRVIPEKIWLAIIRNKKKPKIAKISWNLTDKEQK